MPNDPVLTSSSRTAADAPWLSPRKFILLLVLAASILVFFLILIAGAIALLREAAPAGHSGLARLMLVARHMIVRHLFPHHK